MIYYVDFGEVCAPLGEFSIEESTDKKAILRYIKQGGYYPLNMEYRVAIKILTAAINKLNSTYYHGNS